MSYTLTPEVAARTFVVRMDLSEAGASETFRLPEWSPGYYNILGYRKKISGVKATDAAGEPLAVSRDGVAWKVANPAKTPIRLTYRVLADDKGLGFFWAHLRADSGFVNGPSTFMWADGRKEEDVTLRIRNPEGWDVATGMDPVGPPAEGVPENFKAKDYDELIDHPIQLGKFVRKTFTVEGIPFEAVWVSGLAPLQADLDAETERLRLGSIPAIKMMRGASFKRYVYIVHLEIGDFSGGLEHRASNVIAVPNLKTIRLDDLATHEYFHAWNVKQIRPKALGPFDYTTKVRTANLWFSEGVTDYYAKLHSHQAGLEAESYVLDSLTSAFQEVRGSTTEKKITLEECSKGAWENGGFGIGDYSYYTKGMVVGFLFDAYLRGKSDGKTSLDDVMRALYERGAIPKPGFAEEELRTTLVEFGGAEIGPIYDRMVRSTAVLPYELAEGVGLRILTPGQPYASPRFQTDGDGNVLAVATPDEPVQRGDRILSLRRTGSDAAEATVSRNGQTAKIAIGLRTSTVADVRLQVDPFASEAARARRENWLQRLDAGTPKKSDGGSR